MFIHFSAAFCTAHCALESWLGSCAIEMSIIIIINGQSRNSTSKIAIKPTTHFLNKILTYKNYNLVNLANIWSRWDFALCFVSNSLQSSLPNLHYDLFVRVAQNAVWKGLVPSTKCDSFPYSRNENTEADAVGGKRGWGVCATSVATFPPEIGQGQITLREGLRVSSSTAGAVRCVRRRTCREIYRLWDLMNIVRSLKGL